MPCALSVCRGISRPAIKAHKRLRKLRYDLDFCRAVWPAERVDPLQNAVDALRTPPEAGGG
jgi:hypothetical protein